MAHVISLCIYLVSRDDLFEVDFALCPKSGSCVVTSSSKDDEVLNYAFIAFKKIGLVFSVKFKVLFIVILFCRMKSKAFEAKIKDLFLSSLTSVNCVLIGIIVIATTFIQSHFFKKKNHNLKQKCPFHKSGMWDRRVHSLQTRNQDYTFRFCGQF